MPITDEQYNQHIEEEKRSMAAIYRRIDENDKKRDEQHAAVMKMLTPVYQAFDFKNQFSKEAMANVVKWTKIIALILSVFALIAAIWRFLIISIPK